MPSTDSDCAGLFDSAGNPQAPPGPGFPGTVWSQYDENGDNIVYEYQDIRWQLYLDNDPSSPTNGSSVWAEFEVIFTGNQDPYDTSLGTGQFSGNFPPASYPLLWEKKCYCAYQGGHGHYICPTTTTTTSTTTTSTTTSTTSTTTTTIDPECDGLHASNGDPIADPTSIINDIWSSTTNYVTNDIAWQLDGNDWKKFQAKANNSGLEPAQNDSYWELILTCSAPTTTTSTTTTSTTTTEPPASCEGFYDQNGDAIANPSRTDIWQNGTTYNEGDTAWQLDVTIWKQYEAQADNVTSDPVQGGSADVDWNMICYCDKLGGLVCTTTQSPTTTMPPAGTPPPGLVGDPHVRTIFGKTYTI